MADVDSDSHALLRWLASHDEACPVCGYSLLGLGASQCPECGAPLRLAVRCPTLIAGPWTLSVISFALALGFDAVITIVMIGVMLRVGTPPLVPIGLVLAGIAALGVASAIGLGLVLRGRARWMRSDRRTQWRRGRLIFLIVGAVHAGFGLVLALVLT